MKKIVVFILIFLLVVISLKIINKAECYAKANGLNSIDEIIIKEILNDEATDKETLQTTEQV